jgi:hypothetical protein
MFFQYLENQVTHELLRQLHQFRQFRERDFRFDHPEFGQVPPRLRFFRAESGAEAIDLAERHRRSLQI